MYRVGEAATTAVQRKIVPNQTQSGVQMLATWVAEKWWVVMITQALNSYVRSSPVYTVGITVICEQFRLHEGGLFELNSVECF